MSKAQGISCVLTFFFEPLAEGRDFFGVDLAALDQAHDQVLAGAAEHAVDEVSYGVRRGFRFGHRGGVLEGAAAELALELALAVQDVQHRLHGGVGEVLRERGLDGGGVGGTDAPDGLHDLQLELGEGGLFGHAGTPNRIGD